MQNRLVGVFFPLGSSERFRECGALPGVSAPPQWTALTPDRARHRGLPRPHPQPRVSVTRARAAANRSSRITGRRTNEQTTSGSRSPFEFNYTKLWAAMEDIREEDFH